MAAGAPGEYNYSAAIGYVGVFQYIDAADTWGPLGQLITSSETEGDNFGDRIALSSDGTILAAQSSSRMRVYRYNLVKDMWLQLGQDLNRDAQDYGFPMPFSLSGDGKTLAVWQAAIMRMVRCLDRFGSTSMIVPRRIGETVVYVLRLQVMTLSPWPFQAMGEFWQQAHPRTTFAGVIVVVCLFSSKIRPDWPVLRSLV